MAGNEIAISEQGAQEIKALADALPESVEVVTQAAQSMEDVFEQNKSVLGPHTGDIEGILETIKNTQAKGQTAVVKVSSNLQKVSAKIMQIVQKNLSAGGGGATP